MTEKPRAPFSSWRRWGIAGFLLFPLATAGGVLVGHFGGEQRGWVAGFLVGTLIMLIRISWPLRRKYWFWAAVTAFAVADVLAVRLIDWFFTDNWNGHTMSGLAVLDLGAMMAIIYGLYRMNYGPPATMFEEDSEDLPDYAERNVDL
jgi:hypothetical protein